MQVQRYGRAQHDRPAVTKEDNSIGPKLLGVLSDHLQRRNDQRNTEDFVLQCSDFDDRLRTFEMLEMEKQGHDADGAVQRGSVIVENLSAEKEFMSDELTDRFQIYAASRRETLLNRLGRHQMNQAAVALKSTVQTATESHSKSVYRSPDELEAELELMKIDLEALGVPNTEFADIQAVLADHAIAGVIDSTPALAQEYLGQHKKYFTQDQIEKYHDQALRAETRQIAAAKKAEGVAVTEIQNDFINRLDDLSPSEIRESNLPPVGGGSKIFFLNLLNKRDEAIIAGKKEPHLTIDPAVDAQLMKAVYSDTPPTELEIQGYIGAGLTVARAEHWIKQLDKPDRGYKRALEYFQSQIMPRQALDVGESSPNAASYWQAVMALDEYLETDEGQKLNGNEILKKATEFAPDYVLTLEEQIEAAKIIWSKGKKPEPQKRDWWNNVKDWMSSDDEGIPPEVEVPQLESKTTDDEIAKLLAENGYMSNDVSIAQYRKNNGI